VRVLVAGYGYVGTELARRLVAAGDDVWGLRRSPGELPPDVRPVVADVTAPATLASLPRHLDALVYAVSPAARDDGAYRSAHVDGLRNVVAATGGGSRLLFVSSTAVYGQTDGSEVDEDSPTEPDRSTAGILLEAETVARDAGGTVLRLSGIYGPGRTRLIDEVRAGTATYPPEATYTNRIHRDDAAAALAHLLHLDTPAPVYVGVDDDPAPRREVLRWLADRLGAPPPREARDRRTRGGNKRCRNARLRATGWAPTYPSFRDGYGAMLG
jgi:nucleoside-diphosphate-sugar epimerase